MKMILGCVAVMAILACDKGPSASRQLDWQAPATESDTNSPHGDGAEWRGRPSTAKEVCCRTMGNPWTGSECLFQNQHQVDIYHQCVGD
jgi:hypothetical protein